MDREILEAAFEQIDGQWVWYANAWSGGIMVSPSERELYLSFKPLAFRKALAGRPASYPRRAYWPTLRRMVAAGNTRVLLAIGVLFVIAYVVRRLVNHA